MAESVIKIPNKKTLLNFTPVTGVTVVDNRSYIKDDGLVSICLHLKINVNLTSRTNLGRFNDYPWSSTPLPIEGLGATTQDSFVNCITTGFIENNGTLYLGDYVSNSLGFAEVTVITSHY